MLGLDPGLGPFEVASDRGEVAAFDVQGKGVVKIAEAFLFRKAHSLAVDARHGISFVLPDVNDHAVLRIVTPTTE